MDGGISESEFYMWRTVIALAHIDGELHGGEVALTSEILNRIPFSEAQRATLLSDLHSKQDVYAMFDKITDDLDQAEFFRHAKAFVMADGEYSPKEQAVMMDLTRQHLARVNVDDLVGDVHLQLEDDGAGGGSEVFEVPKTSRMKREEKSDDKKGGFSFRERFLKERIHKDKK